MPNSILSACKKIAKKKKLKTPTSIRQIEAFEKLKLQRPSSNLDRCSLSTSPHFADQQPPSRLRKLVSAFGQKAAPHWVQCLPAARKLICQCSQSTNQRSEWMNGGIIQAEPPAFPLIFTFSRLFCNYSLAKLLWSITFITQRAGSEVWRITRESQWLSKPFYLAILYFLEIFQSN